MINKNSRHIIRWCNLKKTIKCVLSETDCQKLVCAIDRLCRTCSRDMSTHETKYVEHNRFGWQFSQDNWLSVYVRVVINGKIFFVAALSCIFCIYCILFVCFYGEKLPHISPDLRALGNDITSYRSTTMLMFIIREYNLWSQAFWKVCYLRTFTILQVSKMCLLYDICRNINDLWLWTSQDQQRKGCRYLAVMAANVNRKLWIASNFVLVFSRNNWSNILTVIINRRKEVSGTLQGLSS